jgi:hypothetical protein
MIRFSIFNIILCCFALNNYAQIKDISPTQESDIFSVTDIESKKKYLAINPRIGYYPYRRVTDNWQYLIIFISDNPSYLTKSNTKLGLYDKTAQKVTISPVYSPFEVYDNCLLVGNDKGYGLLSFKGDTLFPFSSYAIADMYDGAYFVVDKNHNKAIINDAFDLVTPYTLRSVSSNANLKKTASPKLLTVHEQEGPDFYGIYDPLKKEYRVTPQYDQITQNDNGSFTCMRNGKYYFLDKDAQSLNKTGFNSLSELPLSSKKIYLIKENNTYQLYNDSLRLLFSAQLKHITVSGDEIFCFGYNQLDIYNSELEKVKTFPDLTLNNKCLEKIQKTGLEIGYVLENIHTGKQGYYWRLHNKMILEPIYDSIADSYAPYVENAYVSYKKNNKFNYLQLEFSQENPTPDSCIFEEMSIASYQSGSNKNPDYYFIVKLNGKYGLQKMKDNAYFLKPEYDKITFVKDKHNNNRLITLTKQNQHFVVLPSTNTLLKIPFDEVLSFDDELAVVKQKTNYGIYNFTQNKYIRKLSSEPIISGEHPYEYYIKNLQKNCYQAIRAK